MFIEITDYKNMKHALNINCIVSVDESTENSCYIAVADTKIVCIESYDVILNKIREVTSKCQFLKN